MNESFRLWESIKDNYDFTRVVHVDLKEAWMKIYFDGECVVRIEGIAEELEEMYLQAAKNLMYWIEIRGRQ